MTRRPRVAAVVGPTAVGKTEISIEVAERLGGEIVSVDSMQIYRGMDIGTAKPSAAERARVPHHLLDVFDAGRDVSVAEFQSVARAAIDDIVARGRMPLLVGGSGLYFRAVVDDLRFPPRAAEVRATLEDEIATIGRDALYQRLRALDPRAAERIEPSNARRIVRALEVMTITGRRFSDDDRWERYESIYQLAAAGLARPRGDLYARIERRVDDMLRAGLIEEATALERAGLGATGRQALGYRQILDRAGEPTGSVRDDIVRATKRFARRQESWFRGDPRIEWFEASDARLGDALVAFFASSLALT